MASPALETNVPATQLVRSAHAVAGSASWSQFPAPHSTAGFAAPAQCWPAVHAVQTAGEVGVPATVCTMPGRQSPALTHMVWFGPEVYVPGGQARQVRSLTSLPGESSRSPASQVLHGVQLAALLTVLKRPLGQAPQMRSPPGAPFASTY